jgi:hypothetical protein
MGIKKIIENYDQICLDYKKQWALQDKVLYDLCKKYPDHSSQDRINAKLCLIGRTYATGIERKVQSSGEPGSSIEKLAYYFFKNRGKIDAIIGRVKRIKEPLNPKKIKNILQEHGNFVNLTAKRLRKRESARSFASKYLHFHSPIVPLFDSWAYSKLISLYPWKDSYEIFSIPEGADENYYDFLLRFWQCYSELKEKGKKVTVRFLDYYLR